MKTIVIAGLLLLLPGCASVRDEATLLMYQAQHKVLVFVAAPCPGGDKPYLVSGWVREKDVSKVAAVCDPTCSTCKVVVAK